MGRLPTLSDLVANQQRLEIACSHPLCARTVQLPPEDAVRRLGGETTFAEAKLRLVCSGCGRRGRDGWVSCRPSVDDFYDRRAAWHRRDHGYAPAPGDARWLALPRGNA